MTHTESNVCTSSISPSPLALDNSGQITALLNIYPELKSNFLTFITTQYGLPEHAINRLDRMFDYTILGGKYNRACLLLNTVQTLCSTKHSKYTINDIWHNALCLGWAIEILQALFLVADDIMDKSITRRGQPCWYQLHDVQSDAINDTLILESFLFYILRTNIINHQHYISIVHLYQSVSLETQMGQMLDLMSVPNHTQKSIQLLNNFTLDNYIKIVTYKTALYSFYLPLAAGMYLCDVCSTNELKLARVVSIELGKKFQIQDDYLDCYGNPEIIGKIGTDIRDHKCSWLIVQALERVAPEQRTLLEKHYGHEDGEQQIKQLYNDLQLDKLYEQQENESFNTINHLIDDNVQLLPSEIFRPILLKIHKRQK